MGVNGDGAAALCGALSGALFALLMMAARAGGLLTALRLLVSRR
jgi:hypothetical protein